MSHFWRTQHSQDSDM
ncbi:rCG33186, partial [Rattus norvegicus]